jgi:xylan 1,4-beta-xylosidase
MSIQLTTNAAQSGSPLFHYWSECVGAGRACEGLRAAWQDQLRKVIKTCGFRYLRFHGLYHDDMFVYREVEGRVIYNFQYVDELFDKMLELGIRPFVEFGFCPGDLAAEKETVFWWKGHGAPPKDYGKWAELIEKTVRHWIHRYGIEEVGKWYFEVWNEPNLWQFFHGTKSQYFELYKVTVQTVKSIDAQLRVGGPATSAFVPDARFAGEKEDLSCHHSTYAAEDIDVLDWRPVWVEDFLAFCAQNSLPVDFVSAHPYPTDWALDEHGTGRRLARGVGATPRDMALLRSIVRESAYPTAEIHLTEWSTSPSPRDHTHDTLHAASYVVKAIVESIGSAESLSYWTFTDIFEENGAGDTIFHGGFGMINFQGIVKPVFHIYRFLHALGDQCIERGDGFIVTKNSHTGGLTGLAYHYPPEMMKAAPGHFRASSPEASEKALSVCQPTPLSIEWTGLPPHASVLVETLDRENGDALTAWRALGKPETPTREQAALLKEAAANTRKEILQADATGRFTLNRPMTPCSVVLIQQI